MFTCEIDSSRDAKGNKRSQTLICNFNISKYHGCLQKRINIEVGLHLLVHKSFGNSMLVLAGYTYRGTGITNEYCVDDSLHHCPSSWKCCPILLTMLMRRRINSTRKEKGCGWNNRCGLLVPSHVETLSGRDDLSEIYILISFQNFTSLTNKHKQFLKIPPSHSGSLINFRHFWEGRWPRYILFTNLNATDTSRKSIGLAFRSRATPSWLWPGTQTTRVPHQGPKASWVGTMVPGPCSLTWSVTTLEKNCSCSKEIRSYESVSRTTE